MGLNTSMFNCRRPAARPVAHVRWVMPFAVVTVELANDYENIEICAGERYPAIRTLPLAELLDECRPQWPDFLGIIDSRLHKDQLRGWIHTDALAIGAEERELSPGSRKQP